jgi:hypothetical protein
MAPWPALDCLILVAAAAAGSVVPVLTLLYARAMKHQPTLGATSHDEVDLGGKSIFLTRHKQIDKLLGATEFYNTHNLLFVPQDGWKSVCSTDSGVSFYHRRQWP